FHIDSAFELLRVAGEVRIFPLVTLDREWSPHVDPVRSALESAGYAVEVVAVPDEFQRARAHAGSRVLRAHPGEGNRGGAARLEALTPGRTSSESPRWRRCGSATTRPSSRPTGPSPPRCPAPSTCRRPGGRARPDPPSTVDIRPAGRAR